MLQPGTKLDHDKYHIEAVIGRGGFGYVYRARERLTGEAVAIKELVPNFVDDQQMVQRFIQEARATLHLTHTHIARTYGIFEDQGTYYLAMEYLAGGSLADKLKAGPLSVEEAVRIASDLCEALAHAQQEGVVHCDIKPANVLFDENDEVRLADFGIAHVSTELMTRPFLTAPGTAMGTVMYMAPEQLEGVRDDLRVDLYAVGAILYEMLAGRPYLDFEMESTPLAQSNNIHLIRTEPPRPLRSVNPGVPAWLEQVVERALDKKPGGRPQDAGALRELMAPAKEPSATVDKLSRPTSPSEPLETFQEASRRPQEPPSGRQMPVPRNALIGLAFMAGLLILTVVTLLILDAIPRPAGRISGPRPGTSTAPRPSRIPNSPPPSAPSKLVSTQQAGQPPSIEQTGMLGTEDSPIVWSFVPSGEMETVATGAQEIADLLQDETGLFFETSVTTEYAGVIEAMCADPPEAHMGSLATFSYVLANERCGIATELVAVRFGSPTYNGQIITQADSGISSLADLAGRTFCRPDPLSTSGWIIPELTMRAARINPESDLAEIVDAGSHDVVVAAVYNGDCDAGASYVDARGTIEEDNPDVMEKVVVIEVTEDIPNDGVQFIPDMEEELRTQIVDALMAIAETEEGQEALDTAYSWAGLEKHGDEFYDPFRQVLQASGLSIEDLAE